jgi:hypothetical protein
MHIYNILVPEQFGFRQGRHTEKAAYKLTDNAFRHVGEIFCDLAKVLDRVNHEILPAKLDVYGIHGTRTNWFPSCLTDTTQKLK